MELLICVWKGLLVCEFILFFLKEASLQRRSSSMPTESVPAMRCVLLSTGYQVCMKGEEMAQWSRTLAWNWLYLRKMRKWDYTPCLEEGKAYVNLLIKGLWLMATGDPRRPYPTDLEMRSGMLGHMSNLASNGVNGHLPGDALAAGRLPGMPPVCFGLFADCFEFELKQIFKTVSCFPRWLIISLTWLIILAFGSYHLYN